MEYYVTRSVDYDELMHYGVLGMKWGHRKANYGSSSSSSKKGYKYKSDYLVDKYEKSGSTSPIKLQRQTKNYIKQTGKDLKKARKLNDEENFNRIAAGRTYMKMLSDANYLTRAVSDAAVQAKVEVGKDFKYQVTKNEKRGTVDINVNGTTSSYAYAPEFNRRRR